MREIQSGTEDGFVARYGVDLRPKMKWRQDPGDFDDGLFLQQERRVLFAVVVKTSASDIGYGSQVKNNMRHQRNRLLALSPRSNC